MTPVKQVNLLPRELRPKVKAASWLWLKQRMERYPLLRNVLASLLVVGFFASWQVSSVWRYRMENVRLRKQLEEVRRLSSQAKMQLQSIHIRRAETLTGQERMITRWEGLTGGAGKEVPLSVLLVECARAIPEGVFLSRLSLKDGILKVTGSSPQTEGIAAFMTQLESSGRFSETTFNSAQRPEKEKEQQQGYEFEISTRPVSGSRKP